MHLPITLESQAVVISSDHVEAFFVEFCGRFPNHVRIVGRCSYLLLSSLLISSLEAWYKKVCFIRDCLTL